MIVNDDSLPSVVSADIRKKIQDALKEMSESMTRVEAEKDFQKDVAERMLTECMVPKKDFNKLARIYHASTLAQEAAKSEEFKQFAEAVLAPMENRIEQQ
jgi:siroheme synthase (precorrin-2 oxidase/ferrochelatase)